MRISATNKTGKLREKFMMMRMLGRLALAGSLVVALATPSLSAFGDIALPCKRIALVIGNSKYEKTSWMIRTARNDAVEVGDALDDLGFRVRKILDADHATLLRGLTDFWHKAAAADIAVIFFSGHASTLKRGRGEYLIPVDSRPTDGGLDRNQGVPLDLVLWAVQPASNLRLVIMDAHHSEPPKISSEMLFVAYAGRPGEMPNDGPTPVDDDKEVAPTSPYTWALLRHLRSPDAGGLDLGVMFRTVSIEVAKLTAFPSTVFEKQIPVVYGSFPHEQVVLSPLPAWCLNIR